MIWNIIPNNDRLSLWKKLRDDIKDLPLYSQLERIAEFFSDTPYGTRTLDYYNPTNWPTPWEILFYGSFCPSSISLLIYYTLILLPNEKEIELILVEDVDGIYLLPMVNNHLVLNYHLGEVSKYSNICDNFKVLKKYTPEQIRKIT